MIVYIAGKMTGLPDKGRAAFEKAEQQLKEQGHIVLSPATLPDGMPEKAYMPICTAMLDAADAIYLLRSWVTSRGAIIEKLYAAYQGKEILYEPKEDECRT